MSAIGKFMWDIPRLLVVEDEEDLNGLICNILIEEGYLCHNAYTAYEAVELILNNGDYLAILDYSLPDGTAKQIVEGFTDKGIELPFMVMTGYGDEEIAVEMMKLGARDYLIKDRSLLDILPTRVNQVMDQLRMEAELTQTRKYLQIALDESMKRSREMSGLLNAARDILEIPDFKSVAGSIFHSCKNLLGVKSGYVALLSEDGKSNEILLLDSGGIPCLVDPKLPMPIRGFREVANQEGCPVFENDFSRSKWTKYLPDGHMDIENVLFAPLIIAGETLGLIGLANKPGGFDQKDVKLASAFADLCAIALRNSRMLKSLESITGPTS